MRLTLRTLLAYLDDRLSPGNAREIGKKLKDSPFAQELADRIRTVMRQRRLTTPGRKVKMIDPNLIAEYLDDQLTPELVSLIEKEVLSSDFSLAEVAASHEIIGLIGDPVNLDHRLKERLLKQNPHRSADDFSDHELDKVTQEKESDPAQDVWKPLAPQKEFSPRSPALILAALLIGWLALLLTEQFREPRDEVASSTAVPPEDEHQDDEAAAANVDEMDEVAKPAPQDGADSMPAADGDEHDPVSPADELSGDSGADDADGPPMSVEADPSGEESAEPPTDDQDQVPPDQIASAGDSSADVAVDLSDSLVVPEPPLVQQFEFVVDDPHGMLLSRAVDGSDWTRAVLLQGESADWHDLVTDRVSALPDPLSAQVTPVDVEWSARLIAPCLVQFNDGPRPELRVYDGRCVIIPDVLHDGTRNGELKLVAGGVTAKCSLSGADFRLGVLVIPMTAVDPALGPPNPNDVPPPGSPSEPPAAAASDGAEAFNSTERLPLGADTIVTLFVAKGSAVVEMNGDEPITVEQGRALQWTTASGSALQLQLSEPGQLEAIPDWVYAAGEAAVPEVEAAKTRLASAFDEFDSTIDAAEELCNDRNPLVARFAAAVLSTTREVERLVQVLLQTDEEQVRIESIRGLQNAAAQTLQGRQDVLRALENRLPMRDLSHFVRLLQGVTPAEAELEETSVWLVAMLRHDRAPIRQMAFMILVELTGQINGYHPDSDLGRRNDSVKRWERMLRKNENRILVPE